MSNLTQRRHQGGSGVGVGGGGGNGPSTTTTMDPLHGSHGQPSSTGGYGYGSSTLNRWLPDSSSISYPTSNWEAKELYKSEQSAAGLSWKRDILTIMTRFVTGFDGLLLLLTSFLYMFGPEKVVGNWFGSMHNVPPSARDICSALTQASGGLSFMCACLLLSAAPFVTARHAPWLAFAHWVSTLSISKNIFDSAPYDLGVDRFIVAAAASLHLFPALAYTVLTIANAITREDPMMIAPWKSLQRGRTPANLVFFGLGCFYVLWSISWMLFPSYTVKRSIYDRLSSTPLKYAANNEYAVAGPFFFLGLLHIAFSGLASMTRELPLAAAFGHALNMGLDAVSWFSGGAMDAASFRPSILYGALILHLLLAVAHSILSYFVEPHTGLVQMAQETANVLQQNQTMAGLGETVKETLGMGAGAEGAGAGIGQQASHLYQKVKESLTPSETYGTSAYTTTPAGSMTEQASQYAEKAKDTAQTYAEKAKDTVQSYAEKGKESGKGMMQQSSGMTGTPSFKVHEETTPASSTKAKSGDKGTHIERGPGGATESKTSQHTAST